MATAATPPVYGMVTVDGIAYIERPQLFVMDHVITVQFGILNGLRLSLPGVADFLLKGLTVDHTIPGSPISHDRLYKIRLVGADGTTWFFTGNLGIFDDRVVNTLCTGSGSFPWPVIPPVPIHASGSLIYEIEDLGVSPVPYTIHLGFQGHYLIPAVGAGAGQGPLAFNGGQGVLITGATQ